MLHFEPKGGYFGDPIPFYHDGVYHVFFLKTIGAHDGNRFDHLKWGHAVSKDLLHWEELPVAVRCGKTGPDKEGCWTGSVIFADGTYWMFYTGWNPKRGDRAKKRDQHRRTTPQTVCLATSGDSVTWKKHPGNPVLVRDATRYAWGDWRDPFVFYNEKEQCYWMTVTARLYDKADAFGGAVALAKSKDLVNWDVCKPVYAPGNTDTPECTDVFALGRRWYLVYSNFGKTWYRIGTSPAGPWKEAATDCFDGERFYAAKTLFDGKKRYVVGWIPSRAGKSDSGGWQWGGHMGFPREIAQAADGSLYTKLPAVYERHFAKAERLGLTQLEAVQGAWKKTKTSASSHASHFSTAFIKGKCKNFYLEATLKVAKKTPIAGVSFYAGDLNQIPYEVRLDFVRGDVALGHQFVRQDKIAFNRAGLKAGDEVKLKLIVENSIVEIFVDDAYSLAGRAYNDPSPGRVGFFVENGSMTVRDVRLKHLP
jgi:beta-fructofuranosidase